MKRNKNLKDVPIAENSSSILIRKIDSMSKRQKCEFLFFFLVSNILFLISQKYGPPFYRVETLPFEKRNSLNTKKFDISIGNFNFLNDYLTLDLVLTRDEFSQKDRTYVDVSLLVKSTKGKRSEILDSQKSDSYEAYFMPNSSVSEKVRLYERWVIDFYHIDSEIVLKFDSETFENENNIISGALIFTYCGASHSVLEEIIRLIFFIGAIIWLIYFSSIDITQTSTIMQLKLIKFILILIVFSSNPFYLLSYFANSRFITFFDSMVKICLVFMTLSATFVFSNLTHINNYDISKNGFIYEAILAFIPGLLLCSSHYCKLFSKNFSPIVHMLLNFVQSILIVFCVSLLISSSLFYRGQNIFEKVIMMLMVLVTTFTVLFCEVFESDEKFVASIHAIQIYSFASVSTYVFFLAYLFSPVSIFEADNDENSYDVMDSL